MNDRAVEKLIRENRELRKSLKEFKDDLEVAVSFLRAYRDEGPPGRIGLAFVDEYLSAHPGVGVAEGEEDESDLARRTRGEEGS